jgi:hypothetical protein
MEEGFLTCQKKEGNLTELVTCYVGTTSHKTLLYKRQKKEYMWRGDKEEDVSSYLMTLRKGGNTVNWKRQQLRALCGEMDLEGAMQLSQCRLWNECRSFDNSQLYRVIKKSLCKWWLQKKKSGTQRLFLITLYNLIIIHYSLCN